MWVMGGHHVNVGSSPAILSWARSLPISSRLPAGHSSGEEDALGMQPGPSVWYHRATICPLMRPLAPPCRFPERPALPSGAGPVCPPWASL